MRSPIWLQSQGTGPTPAKVAAMALAGEHMEAAMARGENISKYLLAEDNVDGAHQVRVFHSGFCLLRDFAGLVGTRAELRGVLEREFNMDAAANLETRLQVAHVLSAWEEAGANLMCDAQARREVRNSRFPVPSRSVTRSR